MATKTVHCFAAPAAKTPLEAWSYEIPHDPPAGQVDLEITHCGICGSDVHQLDNNWNKATFPLVPGHEIIGKVVAVGPGESSLVVGQRVGIGPQRGSCMQCEECNAQLEQCCPAITKTYAGPDADKGGFAKYIRYNAKWVFKIPDALESASAAPLLCAGITTYHPLRRHCKPGMRVGVIGVGGLGHVAIQFAKAMGCEVTAISRTESKREESLEFGATRYLASGDAEAMAAAKSSLDVILNTSSGVMGMDAYLLLLRPRGVMSCVGLPELDDANKTNFFPQSIVALEKSIVGDYLGSHHEYDEMLEFAATYGVKAKVEVLPLEQVNEAVARVKDNSARYRMVLSM